MCGNNELWLHSWLCNSLSRFLENLGKHPQHKTLWCTFHVIPGHGPINVYYNHDASNFDPPWTLHDNSSPFDIYHFPTRSIHMHLSCTMCIPWQQSHKSQQTTYLILLLWGASFCSSSLWFTRTLMTLQFQCEIFQNLLCVIFLTNKTSFLGQPNLISPLGKLRQLSFERPSSSPFFNSSMKLTFLLFSIHSL